MDPVAASIPKHLMREATEEVKAKNTMGKDDFLKLLMAQLKHQDPINPVNQQEFAAQLAQFSQIEQLSNIGKGIESMKGGKAEESKLQMLGMIGKEVRASGSRVDLQGGGSAGLKYLPDAEATPVKATIYDGSGTLVREIDLQGQKNESGTVVWDGKDNSGNAAPAGKYGFRVHGVDRNGQAKELGSEISGKVTGVETEGAQAVLIVDTGSGITKVELAKVSRVSLPSDNQPKPTLAVAAPLAEPPKAALPKVIQLGALEDGDREEPEAASEAPSAISDPAWHNMGDLIGRLGR